MQPYKNRTVPYKLLASLLYNIDEDIVKLESDKSIRIKSGKMARKLMVSNSRLIDAIEWLKLVGIFEKVDYPIRGVVIIRLLVPEVFR